MTALEFSYNITTATRSLKPFAIRLTRDIQDAEDLLQETLLKAFSNRDKFTKGTNLKAWLYTIMKNTFITNYQRMMQRGTFVDGTDNYYYLNSKDKGIENSVYSNFNLTDINRAIENLEDIYKIPFLMHFRGFKYYEIAETLNIPIGTVKNRIHIARNELKKRSKDFIQTSS